MRPVGVGIEHCSLLNFFMWACMYISVAQMHSLINDKVKIFSTTDMYMRLAGCKVLIIPC